MSIYEYYVRANGDCPARDFINNPKRGNIRAGIEARLQILKRHGEEDIDHLIASGNMVPVRDIHGLWIRGLYELKHSNWRLAVYHDLARSCFVLLNGWIKTRNRQPQDIARAISLCKEYLGEGD
jgi:hypothetical protein